MYKEIAYFPGFNALRFFAAFLVVIFHIEETRLMFELPNHCDWSIVSHGRLAVTFFFVLSGFLITYLLLKEHARHDDVSVSRFYMRRVLRIWPLYFSMVAMGLLVIPLLSKAAKVPYEPPYGAFEALPYYLFFMPFLVNLFYGNHFLTPLWSIGVEEIYYGVWAPVFKWLRSWIVPIMLGVVLVKSVIGIWATQFPADSRLNELLAMLQFDAMAIGGLAAWLLYRREVPLEESFFFSRLAQVVLFVPLVLRLIGHNGLMENSSVYAFFSRPVLVDLWTMSLFAWLLVNVSLNPKSLLCLENRILNRLGDISYGIYMLHCLVISLLMVPFVDDLKDDTEFGMTLLIHVVIITVTILLALASKRYLEDPFLRLKDRWVVKSDDTDASTIAEGT